MCDVGELLPVPGWACGAPGRNRTCNPFGSPLLRRQRMPVSPLVLECASFRAVNQLAFRSRTELDFRNRAVHRLGVRLIPRSSRSILLRMFAAYKCAGHVADRDRRAEKGAQTTGAAVCRGGCQEEEVSNCEPCALAFRWCYYMIQNVYISMPNYAILYA